MWNGEEKSVMADKFFRENMEWMVFTMPVYTKNKSRLIKACFLFLILQAAFVQAENKKPPTGFNINSAAVQEKGNLFYLDANIDYWFSEQVLEALNNGVPLNIIIEIQVIEKRNFLWDRTMADVTQYYQLQYHALTRQYVLRDLNSNSTYNFLTLQLTLASLGTISQLPVFSTHLFNGNTNGNYQIRIKPSLDIEALPSPLRPVAYMSPEWQLAGKWYSWQLKN